MSVPQQSCYHPLRRGHPALRSAPHSEMTIIDDPLLALILRFVVREEGIDIEDDAFIQTQIETLQQHLDRYPREERGERALQWIETHAENYRREWQRKTVSEQADVIRCGDCPLAHSGTRETCKIHDAWLELLNGYIAEEIDSRRYVEKTLRLLRDNKERLRIRLGAPRAAAGVSSP